MGLCRFYQMSSKKSNVLTGSKSANCTHNIQGMVELAKGVGRLLTVIVFEGESVTPLCLLQKLHSCLTLSCIVISTPEVKVGPNNCMSCCPICAYVAQNDYSFLNHIIVRHYWSSFSCGRCLKFIVTTGQQMKRHVLAVGSSRRGARESIPQTTKRWNALVQQDRKSCAVHHPSLVQWPPLRSRLPILHIAVCARPPLSLVTSRCPRSERSQRCLNRVLIHMPKAFGAP